MSYVTFTKAGVSNRVVALNADMVLSVETSSNANNSMINGNLNLIVVGNVATVSAALNSAIAIRETLPLALSS